MHQIMAYNKFKKVCDSSFVHNNTSFVPPNAQTATQYEIYIPSNLDTKLTVPMFSKLHFKPI